jgi:hypothetical protein
MSTPRLIDYSPTGGPKKSGSFTPLQHRELQAPTPIRAARGTLQAWPRQEAPYGVIVQVLELLSDRG